MTGSRTWLCSQATPDSRFIERLIAEAAAVLKPGGRLMMELGYRSLEAVREML